MNTLTDRHVSHSIQHVATIHSMVYEIYDTLHALHLLIEYIATKPFKHDCFIKVDYQIVLGIQLRTSSLLYNQL